MTVTYEIQDAPSPRDAAVVDAGLGSANAAAAPVGDVAALACFARDPDGTVVGGAVGRTWGECCELQQLWVAPAQRGAGVGTRLVAQFEARARGRGCRTFYLTTFSFQAPAFYRKLGYGAAVEITGFPDGIAMYLMTRTVAPGEA